MKLLTFISLFLLAEILNGQTLNDLIGRSYLNRNEVGFDTLIHFDSRVTNDRLICRHFADSSLNYHYLILEQEEIYPLDIDQRQYNILDILKFKNIQHPSFTLIGSNEFEKGNDEFVISIEPLIMNENKEYEFPDESKRIYKVWYTRDKKFYKIASYRIKRYREGFYKKF